MSEVSDMFVCNFMEKELNKSAFKNFLSGFNTTMLFAHGLEKELVWATDYKRSAQRKAVAAIIPTADLKGLFDLIKKIYWDYVRDPSSLGESFKAKFYRARDITMAVFRVDTGARSMDLAGLPWVVRWRTQPAGVSMDQAEAVFMRFRFAKEELLRKAGLYWSGEVAVRQNPLRQNDDYKATAFATWWKTCEGLRAKLGGSLDEERDDKGIRIRGSHAFTDIKGIPIGPERISKAVRNLLLEAGVMGTHNPQFTSKHLRHHLTTFCMRLPVEEGLMRKEDVITQLRHSGPGSLKNYAALAVNEEVAARWDATAAAQRREDKRAQWLRY